MAEVVPALGEGAELAAVGADVGVVDVAVDDVGDRVAARARRAARLPRGRRRRNRRRAHRTARRPRPRRALAPRRRARGCVAIAGDGVARRGAARARSALPAWRPIRPAPTHPRAPAPAPSMCRSVGAASAGSTHFSPRRSASARKPGSERSCCSPWSCPVSGTFRWREIPGSQACIPGRARAARPACGRQRRSRAPGRPGAATAPPG